jgi:hypothetical protein
LEGFVTKFVLSIEMRNAIPCIVVRNKHSYKLKQMYAMFGNLFQRSNLPALNLVETWKNKKGKFLGKYSLYLVDWTDEQVEIAVTAIQKFMNGQFKPSLFVPKAE